MAFKTRTSKAIDSKFKKLSIKKSSNYEKAIYLIANQLVFNNVSKHQQKTIDYLNNNTINLDTLSKAIHLNHTQELHNEIISNSTELSYAKLYYGNSKVRIESNGHIMAMALYCKNIPRNLTLPEGWEAIYNKHKIVLFTKGNNLITGKIDLFNYSRKLRIIIAQAVNAKGAVREINVNIEGVDYWRLLKGNYSTMDTVHWNNMKGVF